MPTPVSNKRVDARGLCCPLPLMRLQRAVEQAEPAAVIELLADDRAVEDDLPLWCAQTGHVLLSIQQERGGETLARVQKRACCEESANTVQHGA